MKLGKYWLIVVSIWLGVVGCGGSGARQMPPQQLVTQLDSKAKQTQIQEQLLKQVAQISVVDFKDYKVGPEDLLGVICLDTEKLNADVRVNGQGEISLQLIGVVQVGGLTTNEIEKKLARLFSEGDYLKTPHLTVSVKEYRHQKVAVTGAVIKPDSYALIGPRSLLEVLGMAGGLSDRASEVVHIIRAPKSAASKAGAPRQPFTPGTETVIVDLNQLLFKGKVTLNYQIQNGDVVHVPYAHIAYVLGAVGRPGEVPIKGNMTVTKAVAQAGGLHIILASNNATILRLDDNGQRQTIPVNIASITNGTEQDIPLKENDIIYVHESGIRRFLFDLKMFNPGAIGMGVPAMM